MHAVESPVETLQSLTDKQREVLDLVVRHKSSKQIARILNISPYTVDQRVTAARKRLGASTRGELAQSYAELKALCEGTAYEFPHVEYTEVQMQGSARDQHEDPVFMLADATSIEMGLPWRDEPVRPAGLEAFDNRFGIFGRILTIPLLAILMVLLALSVLVIGVTLSSIF